MRVKTFRGKSMGEVLGLVKGEMGPDAVILSNQTVSDNGEQVCEVMAALDAPAQPKQQASTRVPGNGNGSGRGASCAAGFLTAEPGDWRREWLEIKDHLVALLKPKMELGVLEPRQRLAMEYLEKEGVEACVLLSVYRSIKEQGETTVLPALSRLVAVRPLDAASWPQPIQIMAGPHGAGKTTALLRAALAHKRAHPRAPVLVVNAGGGQGQGRLILRHYAELSGLIHKELHGPEDIEPLLMSAGAPGGNGRIFVDMPGLKQGETMGERLAALGLSGREDAAAHLVLSPVYAKAQLDAFVDKYQSGLAGSVIWTKLDEACSFGNIINTAHYAGLPVSALAYGPGLKNSMVKASANALWKLIFKRETPGLDRDDARVME